MREGKLSEKMSVPTAESNLVISVAEQLADQSARRFQLNFSLSALPRCHFRCSSH